MAPQKLGSGDGSSNSSAANFRDSKFWSIVRKTVQDAPVTVNLLDGTYTVSSDEKKAMPPLALADLGGKDHRLVIQGLHPQGVVFTRLSTDSMEGNEGTGFLAITQSQNLTVRNLHFTAKHPITYATNFYKDQNLTIEGCSWIDLPNLLLGATGTSDPSTDRVTYRNCVFKRVGRGTGSHMSYNANGSKRVAFVACQFEDCTGDYVRYRNEADFGIVVDCTFKCTADFASDNMPFISVPQFNDDDPNVKGKVGGYEYYGTHFLIANNSFSYAKDQARGARAAFLFHHSGFDPPGRNYLLTPEEGRLLATGPTSEKQALMLRNFGIEARKIHFFNNVFHGVETMVGYRSYAAYGAKSKGWKSIADITDTINDERVVRNSDEALKYFD